MSAVHRSVAGLVGTLTVLALTACQGPATATGRDTGGSPASASTPAASPSTVDTSKPVAGPAASQGTGQPATEGSGTVRGTILRPPGQDPRSGGSTGAAVPVNGDPVRAIDAQGRQVATAVSGNGGAFQLTLPAGRYRLVEDTCRASQQVQVQGHATTTVTLVLPGGC